MLRIIGECEPGYAVFENVTGLLTGESGRWFAQFLYDLAQIGYDAEWHCISASAVGAPHHRDRAWIVAYPQVRNERHSKQEQTKRQKQKPRESFGGIEISADSNPQRCQRFAKVAHYLKQQVESMRSAETVRERFNLSKPPICGANDGVSRRLDRLRRLGNAVVPQIPEAIGRAIIEYEADNQ